MFGRPARLREIWRHFLTYVEAMVVRNRAAEGGVHEMELQDKGDAFRELMNSRRGALLGTCHFGNSDLLGFLLAKFRHPVHMIRLRVGNSRDTDRLADRFGQWVRYLWVNQSENLLFALKDAAQSGGSLVMMCDRVEYSSKVETFQFLGAQRQMPFTIYHLAVLFRMPVVLCLSVPGQRGNSEIHVSTVFEPEELTKEANLARAHAHFQAFLNQLEALLTINPYLWFNALPKVATLAMAASKPTVQPAARPGSTSGLCLTPELGAEK
jgi:predicted LPLAT superfamily acyltransferase